MAKPSLYLASICYGGLATAAFMRSVLELRAACSSAGIPLQLDLLGGEALASRGRTLIYRKFLESGANHLLICEAAGPVQTEVILNELKQSLNRAPPTLLTFEQVRLSMGALSTMHLGDLRS